MTIHFYEFHAMKRTANYHKRQIIREIKKIIKPHLHKSGYVNTQLCHWGSYKEGSQKEGEPRYFSSEPLDIRIQGFTQDGVITDSYCAILTCQYLVLNLEQLWWVYQLAIKHQAKLR